MKKTISFFIAMCVTGLLFSQDLIVTQENDYFSKTKKEKDFTSYRIAVQGGFSYLLGKIDPKMDTILVNFSKKLKKGFNATVFFSYYFTPYLGVGLNGSFFSSRATITGLTEILEDGTEGKKFDISEKMKFYYVAPHFAARVPVMDDKGALIMNASVGFAYHHDKTLTPFLIDIKKPTIASGIDIGYDFNIGENFAIGVMVSMLVCVFKIDEFTMQNQTVVLSGDEIMKSNMSRIDLTLGLRFR